MSAKFKYNLVNTLIIVLIVEALFWSCTGGAYYYLTKYVEEFRFERIHALWGFVLIPLIVFLYFYVSWWRNRALARFGDFNLLKHHFNGVSTTKTTVKFVLYRLAIGFLIIALANPQYGKNEREVEAKGVDIMIALDVSNSMLARDIDAQRDRLKIAKLAIEKLIDQLHGDRMGLVVFAGKAYVQLPITSDYKAAKIFLASINTGMLSSQGTAIGNAIEECVASFDMTNGAKKAVIVISDGENHEDDAVEVAQKVNKDGIIVHTIGMGSDKGVPIPIIRNGRNLGVKKDKDGNTVLTKLNEQMLLEVASAGGGSYTRARKTNVGLDALLQQLSEMEKTAYETSKYMEYEDQFQIYLAIGLLLLMLEFVISERRNKLLDGLDIFG